MRDLYNRFTYDTDSLCIIDVHNFCNLLMGNFLQGLIYNLVIEKSKN